MLGTILLAFVLVAMATALVYLHLKVYDLQEKIAILDVRCRDLNDSYARDSRELRDRYAYLVDRNNEQMTWFTTFERQIDERFHAMLDTIGNVSDNVDKDIDELHRSYESLRVRNELLDNELRENCRNCREVWEKFRVNEKATNIPGGYDPMARDILNPFGLSVGAQKYPEANYCESDLAHSEVTVTPFIRSIFGPKEEEKED